ncbi:MAG: endo-1,4-beta-xylanase [Rhodospirillaceae bacterium]|nr:endo-1,4-beta-xylanase [Rhodospirillales bacterium]
MSMRMSRRQALAGMAVLAAKPAWSCGTTASLRDTACRRGVRFGTAVASGDLAQPAYARLVAQECAVLVPTWEMKWGAVQKQSGHFTFGPADAIADFARAHNMMLRGHTIVWHVSMPDWLSQRLTSRNWPAMLAQHMGAVLGRYRNEVAEWDIVNEAVEPDDGRTDGLRDSAWLRAAGPAYVAEAYKMAAQYAPQARLTYNEYGIEHHAPWTMKRRIAVLKLLERLKKADAPIHYLGMQSHLRVGDTFDAAAFSAFLTEVRDLGIKPQVTEMDVRADRIPNGAEKDAKTADLARAYLETVLAAGCDTVVCWGLSDDKNWRAAEEPDDRPLPFDRNLMKKPLYDAIQASLAGTSL